MTSSARRIDWDMCKPAPEAAPKHVHDARRCEAPGCSDWSTFIFTTPGWAGLRERGRAFCGEHRHLGEVRP